MRGGVRVDVNREELTLSSMRELSAAATASGEGGAPFGERHEHLHAHVQPVVHAMDAEGVRAFFEKHGRVMAQVVTRELRHGVKG